MPQLLRRAPPAEFHDNAENFAPGRVPPRGTSPALELQRRLHASYRPITTASEWPSPTVGAQLAAITGLAAILWVAIGTLTWWALG